jgi:hypothetical protein
MIIAFIKGEVQKKLNFPFDAHLGQGILYCKLEHLAKIFCMDGWMSTEVLPKFWVLMKFISSPSPSKLKGQIEIFLQFYPLTKVFDLYPQSLPDLSGGVMHICDLVMKEKTSPNLDMQAEIYGLQTRKVTCGYNCT